MPVVEFLYNPVSGLFDLERLLNKYVLLVPSNSVFQSPQGKRHAE